MDCLWFIFWTVDSASKHALQSFFDSLRAEVSPYNIRVTVVSPGYIKTNLSLSALTSDGSVHGGKNSPFVAFCLWILKDRYGDYYIPLCHCANGIAWVASTQSKRGIVLLNLWPKCFDKPENVFVIIISIIQIICNLKLDAL